MKALQPRKGSYRQQVNRGTWRLAYWTAGWVIASALLGFGPQLIWKDVSGLTAFAAIFEIGMGVGMVRAIQKHLHDLDELQREIQLNAMGITLGVALIVSVPYQMLEKYGMSPFKAELSHLLILLSLTYLACIILGLRRYE